VRTRVTAVNESPPVQRITRVRCVPRASTLVARTVHVRGGVRNRRGDKIRADRRNLALRYSTRSRVHTCGCRGRDSTTTRDGRCYYGYRGMAPRLPRPPPFSIFHYSFLQSRSGFSARIFHDEDDDESVVLRIALYITTREFRTSRRKPQRHIIRIILSMKFI